MKKKLFGLMALILCTCSGFTACSEDDDDDDSTNSKLVGLWQSTHSFEWDEFEEADGEYNPEAWQEDATGRIEFKADGKVIVYNYHNGVWERDDEGTYKVSGNKLILGDGNSDYETTIDELNNETLILTDKGYDHGGTFIIRTKYRRIN